MGGVEGTGLKIRIRNKEGGVEVLAKVEKQGIISGEQPHGNETVPKGGADINIQALVQN